MSPKISNIKYSNTNALLQNETLIQAKASQIEGIRVYNISFNKISPTKQNLAYSLNARVVLQILY